MPFDINEVNSNDNNEYDNNNFQNMNDIENNYNNNIPYYYSESPDFSGKIHSDIDAAGQFAYQNNMNNGNYNKTYGLFSPIYNYQGSTLFGNNNYQNNIGLFGNSNFI